MHVENGFIFTTDEDLRWDKARITLQGYSAPAFINPRRDTIPAGVAVSLLSGDTVMKIMMIVWLAALSIAYLVAGRSLEQALLAGKVVFIGFILGFVGSKLCAAIQSFRTAKNLVSNYRR